MKHYLLTAAAASVLLAACANQPYQSYQPYPVYPGLVQVPSMVPQTTVITPPPAPVQPQPPVQVQVQTPPPATTAVATTVTDLYGCQTATGATWSVLLQQCVQLFNVANIRMVDPDNPALAAYAIFTKDRKQAEIFSATLPKGIILTAAKGGYISSDGKIRLVDLGKNNWKLVKK
ncbi:hypothetical protein [Conchiformibius kuhniae]|uniref:Lipoprotein n=1 Tax=Conchiformibius kuhniae TaxID=211502 RepID=A0A8T9MRU9_9NEIS|nr:hypothetical protein [Conchiformibius kuhniae]UOP04327.1 hypothetical protein LVJ77_08190 [Conchiformibius kuhniae]